MKLKSMTKPQTTWQYNLPQNLNAAQLEHELDNARALYKARFGKVAPQPEHRKTHNSIVFAFPLPE